MKLSTKTLAFIMIIITIFTSLPLSGLSINANAETEQEYRISSSNSIGSVLSSAFNETSEEGEATNNRIKSVTVSGIDAEVLFKTDKSATIIVGIYDESGLQMLHSGYAAVSPENESVTVKIEADSLPEYYCVKAFMLDSNNMPLCQSYISKEATEAFQQFMDKEVSDFEEESVINFDESEENNFAVLKEDTVIVDERTEANTLVSADEENGVYVFEDIDEKITGLSTNDIFYYEKDNEAVAIKIDDIKINGDVATITRAEAEVSDLFEYVKIENLTTASDADIENATLGEGVTYLGKTEQAQRFSSRSVDIDIDNVVSSEYNFSVVYESVKAAIGVGISMQVKLYYDAELFGKDYIDAEFCVKLTSKATVSVSGGIDLAGKVTLFEAEVPVGGGITAKLTIKPVIKAEAKLTATAVNEVKLGFSFATDEKLVKYCESDGETEVNATGSVDVTVGLNATVEAKFIEILRNGVSGTGGVNADGKLVIPNVTGDDSIKHSCSGCIEGVLSCIATVTAYLKIGTEKISATPVSFTLSKRIKISDFYLSLPSAEFGWGKCPHITYKVTFTVLGEDGKPLANAYVGQLETDSNGVASEYLRNGKYTYTVSADGLLDRECEFYVKDEPENIEIDFSVPDDNTSGVYASGSCGPNLSYNLYNDGDFIISGTGTMYSGCEYADEWSYYKYRTNIKRIIINEGVSWIGRNAFNGYENLKTVKLPESLLEISIGAFSGCIGLTNLIIPNGVLNIANSAFQGCSNLEKVTLGNGVTSIGSYAFNACGYKSINIPESVTDIGLLAFGGGKTESISVSPSNPNYKSIDGVLYNKDVTSLIYYPRMKSDYSFNVPDGVVTIGASSFSNNKMIVKVSFPDTVKGIGSAAFYYCDSLSQITFTDNIEAVGANAFLGTLWYSKLPTEQLIYIGKTAYTYITNSSNVTIKKITIKEGTKTLADNVFANCGGLAIVEIPDTVEKIGYGAFAGRTQLEYISIPDSVTSIGPSAFSGCSNLREVKLSENLKTISAGLFYGCSSLEFINIPESVTSIGGNAFYDCTSLSSVVIPESVEYIGAGCFENCNSIAVTLLNDSCALEYYSRYGFWSGYTYYGFMKAGTLYGYKNSTAEIYSKQDGMGSIKFIPLDEPETVAITFSLRASVVTETASYSHAVKGEQYALIVVKDKNAENLFASDNLLYIDQMTAADSTVSFSFIPKEFYALSEFLIFGLCNHNYIEETVTEATCTSDGKMKRICTYCLNESENVVPALPHTFTEKIIDSAHLVSSATTQSPAVYKYDCASCDAISEESTFTHGEKLNSVLGKTSKIAATQTLNSINLSWLPVEGADGYKIFQKIDGKWKDIGNRTVTTSSIKNLKAGTEYTFAVKAGKIVDGKVIWSDTYTTINTATKAVAPSKITSAQNTTAIRLTWSKCPGATGYRIFYKSGNTWKICLNATTATSHTFTGLKAGSKFTFAVRPYIITDSGVIWSDYTTYTASTLPAIPKTAVTSPSSGKITVKWNAVSGAEAYQLYYKTGNGAYKLYKNYFSVQTVSFSGLKSGTKYTFAVRAAKNTSGGWVFGSFTPVSVTVK